MFIKLHLGVRKNRFALCDSADINPGFMLINSSSNDIFEKRKDFSNRTKFNDLFFVFSSDNPNYTCFVFLSTRIFSLKIVLSSISIVSIDTYLKFKLYSNEIFP